MFYRKMIRPTVLGMKKTIDDMESGESDQSEALGVVLHSDRLNIHSMASVFVALLVETDMIVYKSRAKQLKRQTTSITMHTKKRHVRKSCVMVFPYVPGEWCFSVLSGVKCGRGDRIVYSWAEGDDEVTSCPALRPELWWNRGWEELLLLPP